MNKYQVKCYTMITVEAENESEAKAKYVTELNKGGFAIVALKFDSVENADAQ